MTHTQFQNYSQTSPRRPANSPAHPKNDPSNVNDCFEGFNRATFAFNQGLDIVIFEPIAKGYRNLPDPIQTYITARAATLVSGKIVGDDDQYARLQQQEALARSSAMEYETSQGQFTMFGHPQGQQNYYQSYQPFHALQR